MKRWKKYALCFVCVFGMALLTGCGNKDNNKVAETEADTAQMNNKKDERDAADGNRADESNGADAGRGTDNDTDAGDGMVIPDGDNGTDDLTTGEDGVKNDATDNDGNVNSVTDEDADQNTDDDGTLGDAGRDIVDGVGDAGRDIVDGVEDAGDELAGNNRADNTTSD